MTTLPIKHFEHYIIFEDGCIINSRNGERINGVMNEGGYIRMHLIFERGNRWIYSKTIDGTRHYKYFDSKIEALIYKKEFLENLNLEYI